MYPSRARALRRPDLRFGKFRRIPRTAPGKPQGDGGRGAARNGKERKETGLWRHPGVALNLVINGDPYCSKNSEGNLE